MKPLPTLVILVGLLASSLARPSPYGPTLHAIVRRQADNCNAQCDPFLAAFNVLCSSTQWVHLTADEQKCLTNGQSMEKCLCKEDVLKPADACQACAEASPTLDESIKAQLKKGGSLRSQCGGGSAAPSGSGTGSLGVIAATNNAGNGPSSSASVPIDPLLPAPSPSISSGNVPADTPPLSGSALVVRPTSLALAVTLLALLIL